MRKLLTFLVLIFFYSISFAQDYISYFTGNTTNVTTIPQGGICMMGGATESDDAMKWFLQRCNGGDVLVLRASGSNGYNNYLYNELEINVNSVETIVCNNANASTNPYVLQKIQQAEAIWFAGGDQWDYVSYWRNTPVAALVNEAIINRHIVIGGTSAGMAILGKFYFSAQNGSVTSATALANPYANNVTVDSASFIKNSILDSVITDTHYDNPDRRGRQVAFLARMKKDWNVNVRGISCDEYTAVCIDENGMARIFGNYPARDDNGYFIVNNCEVVNNSPETVVAGMPLTWNQGNQALKVYNVKGTTNGTNSFNLNDWKTGSGGNWQRWYVNDGVLQTAATSALNCIVVPVTLAEFIAKKERQQVLLEWKTVTESNSSYFAVQRSRDRINFETIRQVAAAGNSNQLRLYNCYDANPFSGINYYRLKQADIDGKIQYSKTITINFNKETTFNIYPNPSIDKKVIIETNGVVFQKVIVMNAAGQKLLEQDFTRNQQQPLDVSPLKKGLYFVKVLSGTGTVIGTSKLFVE